MMNTLQKLFVLLFSINVFSQDGKIVTFDSDRWIFTGDNYKLTEYLGKSSLLLEDGPPVKAYIRDSNFKDGIIEFHLSIAEERTFSGVIFRAKDLNNYEDFYVRPHQSGNPDATQYTPVFNGLSGWQLYHGPNYAAPVPFTFNKWMKIKLVVKGTEAEVYIDDMEAPKLFIPELQGDPISGFVGLSGGKGHFADFRYTNDSSVRLKGKAEKPEKLEEGTVKEWWISNSVFDEKELMTSDKLPKKLVSKSQWSPFEVDNRGRMNLARAHGIEEARNMVFAKFHIDSDSEKIQKLDFGYNDRVKVFINGAPLYYGDNSFRSRDYRYLGSIGFFDSVFLPLKKGKNEIVFAVAESFGGWGIMAKLSN